MNRLFLLLLGLISACQTHRMRHTSRQDSSVLHQSTTLSHLEKESTQTFHQQLLHWSADSTAVVIFPKGVISYHPRRGFQGEASAILSYSAKKKQTAATQHETIDQHAAAASTQSQSLATQTRAQTSKSESERKPVSVFSFGWMSVILVGCGLVAIWRVWRR